MFAGIDAGSRAIKIVLVDDNLRLVSSGMVKQGVHADQLAASLFDDILTQCCRSQSDVQSTVATGYARNQISFADSTITEITCHACGVHHLVPNARTIIEIGGQDSKLLKLDVKGVVQDFAMNDRCAAGTGRFLEVVSDRLDVNLEELGKMAIKSTNPAQISSMCIVFAETEIIGLLAGGAAPEDIVAGVQQSIATRISAMAGRNMPSPVVFTGGVARVPGMVKALETVLDREVTIVPDPQFTGALGAAILASRQG
jgi:predicted CoA-substrate-specific enzyme activase